MTLLLRFDVEIRLMITSVVSYIFYMLFSINTVRKTLFIRSNCMPPGGCIYVACSIRSRSSISLSRTVITYSILVSKGERKWPILAFLPSFEVGAANALERIFFCKQPMENICRNIVFLINNFRCRCLIVFTPSIRRLALNKQVEVSVVSIPPSNIS